MCREINHILLDRWLRSLKKIWRWKLFSELPVIVMYLQISHTCTFLVNIWHTAQSQMFLNLIQLSLTLLFKSEFRNLWVTTQVLLYIFFKKLKCPPKTAYLIICPDGLMDWNVLIWRLLFSCSLGLQATRHCDTVVRNKRSSSAFCIN